MADASRALFVARLEAAVVDAYRALLERGGLSAEESDTVLVLAQHHEEHSAVLAGLAGSTRVRAGRSETLFAELEATVLGDDAMAAILAVEQSLSATHLASFGVLESTDAIVAVASILPVESRHVVALDPASLPNLQTAEGAYLEARYA